VAAYGKNEKRHGIHEAQVALITERINQLTEHFKVNKKEHQFPKGLLKLRRSATRLLKYLQRTDLEKYRGLIEKLGLRK
jgi:small subunit ribosomal protein S15